MAPAWASLSALGTLKYQGVQGDSSPGGGGGGGVSSNPLCHRALKSRRQSLALDHVVTGPGGGDFCHLHVREKNITVVNAWSISSVQLSSASFCSDPLDWGRSSAIPHDPLPSV